jgi:hypothetical protein
LLVGLLMLAAGCSAGRPVGAACGSNADCEAPLACAPFSGGYCTRDCSSAPCGKGAQCTPLAGAHLCTRECVTPSDCRAGYQCSGGACIPACLSDPDCPLGMQCQSGACAPYPGAPVGHACVGDGDCSTHLCLFSVCARPCASDAGCGDGQTCALNPTDATGGSGPTSRVVPACIARRGGAAPGAACKLDDNCDRGTCQLGMCVELCTTAADCSAPGMSCATLVALVDDQSAPSFRACLPSRATLELDGSGGQLPVPSTAQSFSFYVQAPGFDFTNVVGVLKLTDGSGTTLYDQPMNNTDYLALPVRYQPAESASTMLVPNSPTRVSLKTGLYQFSTGSSLLSDTTTSVYLKLADAPVTTGTVGLNIYLTDLSGACQPVTLADALAGVLDPAIAQLKNIFAQVGVTISTVKWSSTTAANTIRVVTDPTSTMMLPDLDNLLQQATANSGNAVGLDLVVLRSITDPNGARTGVLGIAGGIPGSPVLGTPHSGAAVSIEALCLQGQTTFGVTAAHELGHTLGLFHSIEQNGDHDPLTDTANDGQQNLMYWLESSGTHLSPQQGQVIRGDPKVQP